MKTMLLLVLVVAVTLQLVTSSPVGPFSDVTSLRGRGHLLRSQDTRTSSVKGKHPAPPPAPAAAPAPRAPPALNLRKGEYMCGDRVCRLQPGQVPEGCNGMCQYRL